MVYNNISYRGVAQVVARLTGGQEVASSSLVTPTIHKEPLIWRPIALVEVNNAEVGLFKQ